MSLLLFFGAGAGTGPVVSTHKRIPVIAKVATMPTLNRGKRLG